MCGPQAQMLLLLWFCLTGPAAASLDTAVGGVCTMVFVSRTQSSLACVLTSFSRLHVGSKRSALLASALCVIILVPVRLSCARIMLLPPAALGCAAVTTRESNWAACVG
jgi:hypothetical protein